MAGDDDRSAAFEEAVTMSPSALARWLDTPKSQEVGAKDGDDDESVGHASGRRIVDLKGTKVADLTDDDLAHMREVVGYVHRHLAQRPDGDVTDTQWRRSLMN